MATGGGASGSGCSSRMNNPVGPVVCGHLHKGASKPGVHGALKKWELHLYCSGAVNSECLSPKSGPDNQNQGKLWMCLQCGSFGCGNEKAQCGHAELHHKEPHSDCHSLAVLLEGWMDKIWCFECQVEMNNEGSFGPLRDILTTLRRNQKIKNAIQQLANNGVKSATSVVPISSESLLRNTSSTKTNITARRNRSLLEECLECQVCLDVAASPIYSCDGGGHIICYICYEKLAVPKRCPSCSSQGFQIPPALERMAQKLEHRMKCDNAEVGCKEEVLSTDLKMHLTTCFFRDIQCKLKGCNRQIVKFNGYLAHLQQSHIHNLRRLGTKGLYSIPTGGISYSQWSFEVGFLLRMQLTDSTFYIWMLMLGDDKEAQNHFATISLFGKNKLPENKASISWTLPVIPFHEDPATEKEKTKAVFGSIEKKLFLSMVKTVGTNCWLPITVEITVEDK